MRIYTAQEWIEKEEFIRVSQHCHVSPEPPHIHEFIEVVYILDGKGTHKLDDRQYDVERGDLLFMNYGCVHSFHFENTLSYINILFSPKTIGESIINPTNAFAILSLSIFNELCNDSTFGKITFSGAERREVETIIFSMLNEYKERSRDWQEILNSYLHILLVKMLRKNERGLEQTVLDDMWKELAEYIEENLSSRLTLSALAQKCFYNPSYFSRVFKDKFGVSMSEYLAQLRLEKAIALLQETTLTIEEICEQVGFVDKSSCYHAFSRYLSASPKDFRDAKRKKTERASQDKNNKK